MFCSDCTVLAKDEFLSNFEEPIMWGIHLHRKEYEEELIGLSVVIVDATSFVRFTVMRDDNFSLIIFHVINIVLYFSFSP